MPPDYSQYRKKVSQRLKQVRSLEQEQPKPKLKPVLSVESKLHVNPAPLTYVPVSKSVMKPSDYELEKQKAEELMKIH